MRKVLITIMLMVFMAAAVPTVFAQTATPPAYDFGDFKSSTLTTKAWGALENSDVEAVLAYTNKCVELYDAKAREMQAGLKDYPAGADQQIFSYWALNDIATDYFILGSAYLKAGDAGKAKEAFQKVVKDYSFGQCYDPDKRLF